MIFITTPMAEGRIPFLHSAIFVFGILVFGVSVQSAALAQDQQEPPALTVLGFPTFTPEFTIQCAEGDVKLFVGEERAPIVPAVWQSPQPGHIYFSLEHSGCRLDFEAAFAEPLSASNTASGVIIHCTAENISKQETQLQIWCAWRHGNRAQTGSYGAALVNTFVENTHINKRPDPWDEKLTWWFQDQAFIRDASVLYWITQAGEWDLSHQVRDELPPYTRLRPPHRLGWSKLSAAVSPNQSQTFRVWIPYIPIPINSLSN